MGNVDILLVDDDPINKILLKKLLEHKKYSVEITSDYKEALGVLNVVLPKVMIIDYTIPGMVLKEFLEVINTRVELNNTLKMIFTARDLSLDEKNNYKNSYNCIALEKTSEQEKMFELIKQTLKY